MSDDLSAEDQAERNRVLLLVQAEFSDHGANRGITLREAEEIDCHGSPEELAAARRLDVDRRWQEVPSTLMEEFSSAPMFLDDAGLHYYLPALMSWSLLHAWRTDSATPDNLLALLGSPHRQAAIQRTFSDAQLAVVAQFVAFMHGVYWNGKATPEYWAGRLRA